VVVVLVVSFGLYTMKCAQLRFVQLVVWSVGWVIGSSQIGCVLERVCRARVCGKYK
jgi:hypothetical protein